MQFSKNFTVAELACRCGCGFLPKPDFMERVETLRTRLRRPLTVTSCARCPEHNAKVSGTGRTGPHTTGRAIDIAARGPLAVSLLRVALDCGFTGIGIAQKGESRFIHLDDLPRIAIWSY